MRGCSRRLGAKSRKLASPPRVGISSCLLGNEVRYDGGHKLERWLRDTLGAFVAWVPVCPEDANSTRYASAMGGADYGVFANGRYQLSANLRELLDYVRFLKAKREE